MKGIRLCLFTFPIFGKIISNGFVWNESYDCKRKNRPLVCSTFFNLIGSLFYHKKTVEATIQIMVGADQLFFSMYLMV